MKKIGIIDCGTNTFNVIVAEIHPQGSFQIIHKKKRAVKLGQGGINNKTIAPEAFQRGLQALKEHQQTIANYQTTKTYAFATSAIRSARNGKEFVDAAKQEAGVDIHVISGEKEAELIYNGVKMTVDFEQCNSLIMDVGGGSTEFIIANNKQVLWKHSFDIGVARLIEYFKPSNPIKTEEINKIKAYLNDNLLLLFQALVKHPAKTLVGCSGSFETFADIILHKKNMQNILEEHNNYTFEVQDFREMNQQLLQSTEKERLQTPGLPESRVDSIVTASIYVNFLLQKLQFSKMKLSLYAIKEGIIAEII